MEESMRRLSGCWTAIILSAVATAACTSGGSGIPVAIASAGSPPLLANNGTPPPTPPPPAEALVDPALTSSPANPVATGGANFANITTGTSLPLVLTTVRDSFSGDSATVASGGTLSQGSNGLGLSLNSNAFKVSGATPNAFPYNSNTYNPPALGGRPVVAMLGPADNLDYTRFGYWTLPDANPYYDVAGGAWLAGYVTSVSQIPTSGSASYSGRVVGLASSYPSCQCNDYLDFAGSVSMTANFASRAISGSMTNLQFTNMEFTDIPLNDIGFAATLDATRGTYTGTTSALTFPVNPYPNFPYAVVPGAKGTITGAFYGPSAQETGAVWTLSDGTHRLIGSFGAARVP
jgi:hypothetical protein